LILLVTEQAALRAMKVLVEDSKRKNYDPNQEMKIAPSSRKGVGHVKSAVSSDQNSKMQRRLIVS
jgi:hypothetical protein